MPCGLNLEPHMLTAHGNPSCEHTHGQAISGKNSACGSRAEFGKRLFLWLVDGFNPNVGWLEHLECCGLRCHGVIPNSGVGAETRVTQSSVPGKRQQDMGRRTVRMEQSIHWFLCVTHCCFGTLQAGNHMFVSFSIVEFSSPIKVIQVSSKHLKSFRIHSILWLHVLEFKHKHVCFQYVCTFIAENKLLKCF